MKKTIIMFILLALPLVSFAQMVSSSSLVITKQKLPPVKAGLQQTVEFGYTFDDYLNSNLELDYVIGYRFNNTFFLGGGVGLGYNLDAFPETFYNTPYPGSPLNIKEIEIPIFVDMKIYFLKTRCTPFFGLSAGAAFSAKQTAKLKDYTGLLSAKYNTIGAIIVPSLGVNYRINARYSLYVAAKVKMRTWPTFEDYTEPILTIGTTAHFLYEASIGFTF